MFCNVNIITNCVVEVLSQLNETRLNRAYLISAVTDLTVGKNKNEFRIYCQLEISSLCFDRCKFTFRKGWGGGYVKKISVFIHYLCLAMCLYLNFILVHC